MLASTTKGPSKVEVSLNVTTPLNGRTFKITSDVLSEPSSVLLTDIGIPKNTYKVFLKDINDPLNN